MEDSSINELIKGIIINTLQELNLSHDAIETIGLDDDLVSAYGLNSSALLSLIIKVEQAFNVELNDNDLDIENFKSINALKTMLKTNYLEIA